MTAMTEIVLPGVVEPGGLQIRTRPVPDPGPGQVVLAVEATGVSFAEQQMRLGRYFGQPPFPFVPGYDAVGTVAATGAGVDPALAGRRFAVVTKVGSWASHVPVDAGALVPVPDGVDPAEAETVVVNGLTAYQMLHRVARVRAGQTVVVLGANGGVGSTLVQLARHAGLAVIGTAAPRHHAMLAKLGAIPVDSRAADMYERIAAVAPAGADAVFDHVGGPGLRRSWRLVRPGGTLVSYGIATLKDGTGSALLAYLRLFARLWSWHLAPNRRSARFYDFWAGRQRPAFRERLRDDLTAVFGLLADGAITPQIAATFPLSRASEALALAESRTVAGKVVLTRDR